MTTRIAAALLALGLLATASGAHDFWLRPAAYTVDAPCALDVHLLVGDAFSGRPYPRLAAHVQRFVVAGPGGEAEVHGVEGRLPVGTLDLREPGLHVVGYRSHGSLNTLPGPAFEDYLAEKGLEHVARERAARGRSRAMGREVFSRCAKALVRVGDAPAAVPDRLLGQRLELVVGADPTRLRGRTDVPVRLVFEGRPRAGALVLAYRAGEPEPIHARRTDGAGRVVLPIEPGEWLVTSVVMVPAGPELAPAAWESLWASLTFEACDGAAD